MFQQLYKKKITFLPNEVLSILHKITNFSNFLLQKCNRNMLSHFLYILHKTSEYCFTASVIKTHTYMSAFVRLFTQIMQNNHKFTSYSNSLASNRFSRFICKFKHITLYTLCTNCR